jgi:GTPase SAR1 family protein
VVGPPNSGKSTLIQKYISAKRGLQVTRSSDIERISFLYHSISRVDVELWDTVGQERYDHKFIYSPQYVRGKSGIILVSKSGNVTSQLEMLKESSNTPVALLVWTPIKTRQLSSSCKYVFKSGSEKMIVESMDKFIEQCITEQVLQRLQKETVYVPSSLYAS